VSVVSVKAKKEIKENMLKYKEKVSKIGQKKLENLLK
jgi:hypothetical protein